MNPFLFPRKDHLAILTSVKNYSYEDLLELIKKKEEELNFYLDKKSQFVAYSCRMNKTNHSENSIEELITLFALWNLGKTACLLPKNLLTEQLNSFLKAIPLDTFLVRTSKKYEVNFFSSTFSFSGPHLALFTSGTSSFPKGVLLSLEGLKSSALATNEFYDVKSSDIWGGHLSLHHIGGLMIPLRMLLAQGACEFPYQISSEGNWPYLSKNLSLLSLVPTQLQRMLNMPQLKNLKAILIGGSSCPSSLRKKGFDLGLPLSFTYGQTEFSSQVSATNPFDKMELLAEHSGKILGHTQIQITPEKNIGLKGASLFKGYFSEKKFYPTLTNHEGFFVTKDRGIFKKKYLKILGRSDLVFLSGGENISPFEIEMAILEYPQIQNCCVISIPDDQFGEIPFAFYLAEHKIQEQDLKDFLKNHLQSFKIPKKFYWLNDEERVLLEGKVNRALLQKKAILCQ